MPTNIFFIHVNKSIWPNECTIDRRNWPTIKQIVQAGGFGRKIAVSERRGLASGGGLAKTARLKAMKGRHIIDK